MNAQTESERTPVISLGAGVQSTALALMAAQGRFGVVPRHAVFADTQQEPASVMLHLDRLRSHLTPRGITVHTVTAGDLGAQAIERDYNPIPLFKRNPDGTVSIGRRQCTKEFKLYPLRRWARARGLNAVDFWLGISLDEIQRMKPANVKWATNRWPLIEERLTRQNCIAYLEEHWRYPVAKSACVFCPYHSAHIWREMKRNEPESWDRAVAFDREMNKRGEYVHASAVPLDEVDLTTPEDHGQLTWDDECEGMCGV